ncbi:MAG: PAS domain-containing sensor histidine kinase [Pseudomonadota bacterium]
MRRSPNGAFLSDFARSAIDWAWACDDALCITQLTEGFTAMTGFPVRQFIGAPLETLLEFSGPKDAAAFMAQLSRGEAMDDAVAIVKADDGPKPVHFSAVPIHSADGELLGLEGGAASAERKQSLFDVDDGDDSQLEIAHQVQHELRTPLNAIAGFAQIMREDLKHQADGRYAGYCDDILSASNHLLGLIDDMVTAYGAGKPDGSIIPVESDISVIVSEVQRLLQPVAEKAQVELALRPIDQVAACLTDRRKLKQIIVNLLENAIKFTPQGARAGIDIQADNPHFVDIVVWDEGPGIDPVDQDRIWQRYEKAGQETPYESSSPGLGLGLSVVKALADGIGAQLSLDSALGNGSRFTIRLPAAH